MTETSVPVSRSPWKAFPSIIKVSMSRDCSIVAQKTTGLVDPKLLSPRFCLRKGLLVLIFGIKIICAILEMDYNCETQNGFNNNLMAPGKSSSITPGTTLIPWQRALLLPNKKPTVPEGGGPRLECPGYLLAFSKASCLMMGMACSLETLAWKQRDPVLRCNWSCSAWTGEAEKVI